MLKSLHTDGLNESINVPDEITCGDQIFDIDFYPKPFGPRTLAVGLINGQVELWRCSSEDENALLLKLSHHTSSCRGVLFDTTGDTLYTISSDMSIKGVNSAGQVHITYSSAHDSAVNKIVNVSENLIATGDDGGVVKLWDARVGGSEVKSWDWHEDFVSGLCYREDQSTLLSIAGDATLAAYDLRISDRKYNDLTSLRNKSCRSDDQEAELSCVGLCKGGRKVLCGTQDGVLLIFSWGRWGDCSDRFPGHPETIDCLLQLDDNSILTGSSDGLIRVLSIHPNKVLGVLGDHDGFPVESLRLSTDSRLLASISHDDKVRFWDMSMFADDRNEEDEGDQPAEQEDGSCGKEPGTGGEVVNDVDDDEEGDWEDDGEGDGDEEGEEQEDIVDSGECMMEDCENDSDDSDDDSDDDDRVGGGGNSGSMRRLPTQNEKFFADL